MNRALDAFFDKLQKQLEALKSSGIDNEAMRHDLIIRPFLTNQLGLGWKRTEIQAQQTIEVPEELRESYFWTGAIPKYRRPDLIIVPEGYRKTVAVIEEKQAQKDMNNLKGYLGQLKEYQYLHHAVWGLLTDGEQWMLQKNFELFHAFRSLIELKKNFVDIQNCIGRIALIDRLEKYGTSDLIVIVLSSIKSSKNVLDKSEKEFSVKSSQQIQHVIELYSAARHLRGRRRQAFLDHALAILHQSFIENPSDEANLLAIRGSIFRFQGSVEKAVADYQRVVWLRERNGASRAAIGEWLSELGFSYLCQWHMSKGRNYLE